MGSYSNPTDKPTSHSVTHIWTFLRLSEVHWIKVINMMTSIILLVTSLALANAGDINRQSIIFNENTPDVFYCPQEKPISIDRMLVKSKPMKKLCEYEGRGLPENVKSDCWNDVDETEYACSEKKRIMLRMNPRVMRMPSLTIMFQSTDLVNTRLESPRIWIFPRSCNETLTVHPAVNLIILGLTGVFRLTKYIKSEL